MGNALAQEPTLRDAVARLDRLLPHDWTVRADAGGPLDGQVTLAGPGGAEVAFDVLLKKWTTAPTSHLRGVLLDLPRRPGRSVLLVSNYLNRPMRQACEQLGVSYLDGFGWTLLRSDDPALLVRTEGEDRPAPRVANEVSRLNGIAAGRVIRALLQLQPPLGVRQLAELAEVKSPGSVSKILPTLVAADAVKRDATGQVVGIHRRRLLERWTQDYSVLHSNGVALDFLAPRGLERVLQQLATLQGITVTGAHAARAYLDSSTVPVVPATRLTLYVSDMHTAKNALGLHRMDRHQANVIMVAPKDRSLLVPHRQAPLPTVPVAQCLADLMTLPGRESSLADQLIDQLAQKDPAWRS